MDVVNGLNSTFLHWFPKHPRISLPRIGIQTVPDTSLCIRDMISTLLRHTSIERENKGFDTRRTK
jgi:hypothetical protein